MNISDDQLDVADWRKVQSVEHISTMLSCVCNAISNAQAEQNKVLERIAMALEHGRGDLEQVMQGVGLDPDATVDGVEFSDDTTTELLSPDGPTQTSFLRLTVEELGFGAEVRSIDSGPVTAYADATAEWTFTSPGDVESLAEFLENTMVPSLRAFAAEWRDRIADGTIPAPEA